MSTPPNSDPRVDQAAVTDESLLSAHEKLLGAQPDDKAHYRLMPLNLLFIFSGLIFFAGTYLNKYSGHFHPTVYNEETPENHGAAASTAPAIDPLELGRKTYATTCQSCHQITGMGQAPIIPPLAGSEWVLGSEERLIRIVVYGLQGPVKVKGVEFNATSMMPNGRVPGSGFNLPDDKIAAILTFVRQEWGNNAGAITKEKVAEIHGKEGDRKPYTIAEIEKIP